MSWLKAETQQNCLLSPAASQSKCDVEVRNLSEELCQTCCQDSHWPKVASNSFISRGCCDPLQPQLSRPLDLHYSPSFTHQLLGLKAGRNMGADDPCYILSGLYTGQSYSGHGGKGSEAGQSRLVR